MFSPGTILHYRGQDVPLTPESGVRIVKNWRTGFPDFHFKIEGMIVANDKVVLRIPFTLQERTLASSGVWNRRVERSMSPRL
jgi:predicted ester cyclase